MLAPHQQAAYRVLGLGMMLLIVGVVLVNVGRQFVAIPFYLAGYVLFIFGSVEYARAKGYSPYWGIFGVLWFVGFIPLLLLRDRHR